MGSQSPRKGLGSGSLSRPSAPTRLTSGLGLLLQPSEIRGFRAIFVEDPPPVPNPSRANPSAPVAAAGLKAFAEHRGGFRFGMPAWDGYRQRRFHWIAFQ